LIEEDGGNRGKWISNLRAGIRSLSGTVNNVLSFHGAGSLTLAPVMLSAQIGNAIQFVRPIADQAGVSLEFVADDDQVDVMGNESALQQIFLNLLSNAIRHTPAFSFPIPVAGSGLSRLTASSSQASAGAETQQDWGWQFASGS
jgi:two-component system sensor histidine kinase FlrB